MKRSRRWPKMVRFSEMPGWSRRLMQERAFRKAAIRAAKMETIEIAAIWDRGNAWSLWRRGPSKIWRKSTNGMHSQASVPVEVSGRTLIHAPQPNEWYDIQFRREVSSISFWNWESWKISVSIILYFYRRDNYLP